MQGIIDRDAHDDRADAHHDDGNARLEQGDNRQSKDPTKEDGDAEPKQVALARHSEHQDAENQHEGQGNGKQAVFLDLLRVGDRDGGCAHGRDMHIWRGGLGLLYHFIDDIHNPCVAFGVAARKWRGEEGKAHVAAIVEEIFILQAIALCRIKGIEALQRGRIKVQGVGFHAIHHKTDRGHRQNPFDVAHTSSHIIRFSQQ